MCFKVEQLRREAAVKRITVSQALSDIQKYVMDKQSEDYLLIGFANNKQNPYREKSSCEILWLQLNFKLDGSEK